MSVLMRTGVLAVLVTSASAPGGGAEELPQWPVHWMCAEAKAIVAAERTGPTTVRVTEWLLPPAEALLQSAPEFEIVGLDENTRVVGTTEDAGREAAKEPAILSSQKLVCFLERKGVGWYAMGAAREGSCGLIWIEGDACYRYVQVMNPGGYILARDPEGATPESLQEEIAGGLADRRNWEAALEIEDAEEKAVVLASYLLPRTAPDGTHGTYRERVRQELPRLGAAAVRELMELLHTARPGDQLGPAMLVLNDLGQEARAALPLVMPLLNRPDLVPPIRILEALSRMGDASVAPEILPFLEHEDLPVRAEVAKALAVFRYHDAAADIGRSLPDEIGGNDAYYVYAILSALKELDPGMAARLARKYVNRPEMENIANLLESFLTLEEEQAAP